MNAEHTDRYDGKRGLSASALTAIMLLRVVVGWHFLYEGLAKLFNPAWSAVGYLKSSEWVLSDFFHWIADSPAVLPWVDFLNIWGLILIGLGLMLGVMTRVAGMAGIVLLALYYFAHPPLVGMDAGAAEGSYLVVNKNIVEMFALLLLVILPGSGFAGLGRYIQAALRMIKQKYPKSRTVGEAPLHEEPEALGRRELIASLATLPILGGFAYAVLKKRKYDSYEERVLKGLTKDGLVDAVTGPSRTTLHALSLDELKGKVPHARLGDMKIARVILGANLMNGYAHARDLIYVSDLVKAYHTIDKVMETLWLAEQCGMNTLVINTDAGGRFIEAYQKQHVGNMQFIAQCPNRNIMDRLKQAVDLGARGAYLQQVSSFVKKRQFDAVAENLDYLRENGLVAGIGDHSIGPIKQCVEQGIEPDFVMKTFHPDSYWSYMADKDNRDCRYCEDKEETIEFMQTFDKPWIAFKTLAAGAVHPKEGFRYAFEKGADFLCVGMYDFQVVANANTAVNLLNSDLQRKRPWKALA